MKSLRRLSYVVLGTLPLAGLLAFTSPAAAADEATFKLTEQNGSGISGTATFTQSGDKLKVTVQLDGAGAGPQPIHIHMGTCDNLNPKPEIPLTNVENGMSVTEIDATPDKLMSEARAINVHKSAQEAAVYVACGNLSQDNMSMSTGAAAAATPGAAAAATPGAMAATPAAMAATPSATGPGKLPATGSASDNLWLVGLAGLIGFAALGAGFAMRRRTA